MLIELDAAEVLKVSDEHGATLPAWNSRQSCAGGGGGYFQAPDH
jgi:hypothetical protein